MLDVKHTISVGSLAGLFTNSYYQESVIGQRILDPGKPAWIKMKNMQGATGVTGSAKSSLNPEGN